MHRKKYIAYVILFVVFFNVNLMAQNLYFSSPQKCVKLTSKLLVDEDWEKLSSYYFLDDADESLIVSLKNGSYFIRTKQPEVAHPGGFWKYKKPFPPSFNYLNHVQLTKDTVKVDVTLEIDQGDGMVQQGQVSFYLIKLQKGYQLLPY